MHMKRLILMVSALAIFFIIPHAQAAFDLPDFDKLIEPVVQPVLNPQVCTPNAREVMRCDNRLWGFRTCNAQGTDWNIEQNCQYMTEAQAQAVLTPPTSTPVLNPETIRTLINLLGQPAAAPAPAEVNISPAVFERINGRDVLLERAANGNFSIRFGETARETTKTIIIKNGNNPLAIAAYGFNNGSDRAFSFARGSNCLGTLAAQATCSMPIKFTPDAARWRLEVFSEIYVESGGRQVVLITAEAIHGAAPSVIAETSSANALIPYRTLQKNANGTPILDWGGTATAVTKSLVLRNAGSVNLSIPAVRLDADPTHSFDLPSGVGACLGTIQPGKRCTMQVRFTPQQGTGLAVSRIIFETNVPTLPGARHEFAVELRGTSLLDAIQQPNLDPAILEGILKVFGNQEPEPAPAEPPAGEPEPIAPVAPSQQLSPNDAGLMADVIQNLLEELGRQSSDVNASAGAQVAGDPVLLAGVIEDLLAAFGQQQLNQEAASGNAGVQAPAASPLEQINVDRLEQAAQSLNDAPNANASTIETAGQLQKLVDILRAEQQKNKESASALPDSTQGYTILLIGSVILLLAIIAGFVMWVMRM